MTLNDWNTANWIRPKSNVDKKWVLVRKVFAGGGAGAGAGGIQKFFILVEECVVGGRWGGGGERNSKLHNLSTNGIFRITSLIH